MVALYEVRPLQEGSMKEKPKQAYRGFVERHFISVVWVDVLAESPKAASKAAKKYASAAMPDVRSTATDNHWQLSPTEIVEIDHIGAGAGDMVEVMENVFVINNEINPAIVLRKSDGTLRS